MLFLLLVLVLVLMLGLVLLLGLFGAVSVATADTVWCCLVLFPLLVLMLFGAVSIAGVGADAVPRAGTNVGTGTNAGVGAAVQAVPGLPAVSGVDAFAPTVQPLKVQLKLPMRATSSFRRATASWCVATTAASGFV